MAWHLASAPPGLVIFAGPNQPPYPVIAIAWEDEADLTRYLVAASGGGEWVRQSEVRDRAMWIKDD